MNNDNRKFSPNNAPVWGNRVNQPYAKRTVISLFLAGIFLVMFFVFVGWYFFSDNSAPLENTENIRLSQEKIESHYDAGTGKNAVYDFFYNVFGGIEEGLEDSPHNLENVEHIDDLNMDTNNFEDNSVYIDTKIDNYIESEVAQPTAEQNHVYKHSAYDVMGSDVFDIKGNVAGNMHDILINPKTGEARAVVIQEDDNNYERDLKALSFKKILKQQPDGDVMTTITEELIEDKPSISYKGIENSNFVSLRHLRDGQIIDDKGKFVGGIDAVIYRNAEAQSVYFSLKPALATEDVSEFKIPFEDIQVVESADGYDIQLTKKQTESLAKLLFGNESK